jgi:hypothetical protein
MEKYRKDLKPFEAGGEAAAFEMMNGILDCGSI